MNTSELKHPRQPIGWQDKVIRFKENKIVSWMLDMGREGKKFDLHDIVMKHYNGEFSNEDLIQLDQLIGYSVSSFGDLSYVPEEEAERCDEIAASLCEERKLEQRMADHPIKPGMLVRVIDETANSSKIGEVGIVQYHGTHPDTKEPAGWIVRFPFSWRRLGWQDHLFESQLEPVEK